MRKGYLISIIGFLLILIGGFLFPFFYLEKLLISVKAFEFLFGKILIFIGLLSFIFSIIFILKHSKREFANINIIIGTIGLTLLTYIFFDSPKLFETDVIIGDIGYYLILFGFLIIILGGIVGITANPSWDPEKKLLRVTLIYKGNIIQDKIYLEPENVSIGDDKSVDFHVPFDLSDKNKLILFRVNRKGYYEIGLMKNMIGKVKIGDKETSINDYLSKYTLSHSGINYITLDENDYGQINFGDLTLNFQFVTQKEKILKRKPVEAFDSNLFGLTLFSGVVHIAFLLFCVFFWKEQPIIRTKKDIQKMFKVEVKIEKEEQKEEIVDLGEDDDTTGKRAEGEEGKFGDPDIDPSIESKVPKQDGKMVKEIDPKKVGLVSLLSSSKLGGSGAISNILSSDMSGFSNKIAIAMSGTGSEFVMGHGSGGLGFTGTGKGGGGIGGYGRIHGLGKIDTGGGVGIHANLGQKGMKKVAQINLGSGSSEGFCEKNDIRNVVLRRAGAIKACYEKELIVKPNLSGKITIMWTISTEGDVTNANVVESTINDSNVEACVLQIIRKMRFTKPKGGICIVRWPFVFHPGE